MYYGLQIAILQKTLKEDNFIVIAILQFIFHKLSLSCLSTTNDHIRQSLQTSPVYSISVTILYMLEVHFNYYMQRSWLCCQHVSMSASSGEGGTLRHNM